MKNILFTTTLVGLLAASGAAFAQDHHDHGGGGEHPPAGGQPGGAPHEAHGPGPAMRGPAMQGPAPAMHEDHRGSAPGPADDHRFNGREARGARPGDRGDYRGPDNRGAARFAPGGNGGPHRDFSAMHRNFAAPRHFHAPAYRQPSGWYAHRWGYGEILPRLFWAPDYWINDFDDFGLAPPPPDTVWVRDGADALLIDRYSGEIIEVEYGVFY